MKSIKLAFATILFPVLALGSNHEAKTPIIKSLDVDLFMYQGEQTLNLIGRYDGGGKMIGEIDSKYLAMAKAPAVKMWYMPNQIKDLEFTATCSVLSPGEGCGSIVVQWREVGTETVHGSCSFETKVVGPSEYFFTFDYSCDGNTEVNIVNSIN